MALINCPECKKEISIKFFVLLILLGFSLIFTDIVFAQSAKDAVMALQKLETRCNMGVSHRDYFPALGDAMFPVNLYLKSEESKSNPEMKLAILKIVGHYALIGKIFQLNSEGLYGLYSGKVLSNEYPNMKTCGNPARDNRGLSFDMRIRECLISIVLIKATEDLSNTTTLLSQSKPAEDNEVERLRKENDQLKKELESTKSKNKK